MSTATAKKAAIKGIELTGLDDFDVGSLMEAGCCRFSQASRVQEP